MKFVSHKNSNKIFSAIFKQRLNSTTNFLFIPTKVLHQHFVNALLCTDTKFHDPRKCNLMLEHHTNTLSPLLQKWNFKSIKYFLYIVMEYVYIIITHHKITYKYVNMNISRSKYCWTEYRLWKSFIWWCRNEILVIDFIQSFHLLYILLTTWHSGSLLDYGYVEWLKQICRFPLYNPLTPTWQIKVSRWKSTEKNPYIKTLNWEYRNDRFWVPFFSTSIYTIFRNTRKISWLNL